MSKDLVQTVARIAMDLHQPNSGEFQTQAQLAVVDAIGQLRNQPFYFNTGRYSFPTVADQEAYTGPSELESDWIAPVGPAWLEIGQSSTNVWELRRISPEHHERRRAYVTSTGTPDTWAYYHDTLYVLPVPSSVHNVRGRYIKKLAEPTVEYDGSSWSVANDTTETAWTDPLKGGEAVRTLACWLLTNGYLNDELGAARWMRAHQAELARLLEAHDTQEVLDYPEPWI